MERNKIEGFDESLLLEASEVNENIKKNTLLKNFIREEDLERFLKVLVGNIVEGYIIDDTDIDKEMKNRYFRMEDRYGRRSLIDKPDIDPEFMVYLKAIIDQSISDSCVFFVEYDPELFEKIRPMVSPSILLGNVSYLSFVANKVNKNPYLVAFIFGYHCSKNSFWIQAAVEIKTKIYKMLI